VIRKFGTVDAPVKVVRAVFADPESWPLWMPKVRAVRILERSGARAILEVDRVESFWAQTTTIELVFTPNGQHERQLAGRAKKWVADWRFEEDQQNRGTLVSCRLDLDIGFMSLLISSKTTQRWIDHNFEQILRGVSRQIHPAKPEKDMGEGEPAEVTTSKIQVFATPTGLEIWIDGRKYVAHAAD